MDPKEIGEWQYEEFYRYVSKSYDKPRYTLHYRTDAPLNIRSIFYVPEMVCWMWCKDIAAVYNVWLISQFHDIFLDVCLNVEANHVWCEQRDGLKSGFVQPQSPDPDQGYRNFAQVAALHARLAQHLFQQPWKD